MNKTQYENYIEMLETAGLEYAISNDKQCVASEDLEYGQIVIAYFNVDENFINITSDSSFNSLDEVRNLWGSF